MTTNVLLEAFLLEIPILSLQPGRSSVVNSVVEKITKPVVRSFDLEERLRLFIETGKPAPDPVPQFRALLESDDSCFVEAIERLIRD